MGSLAFWRPGRGARSPADLAVRGGGWLLFWATVVFVALIFAGLIEVLPLLALAPAALLAVAVACARFPWHALLVIAVLTGMYGTAEAEFGLKAYSLMHLILLGLWLASLRLLIARRSGLRPRLSIGPVLLLALPFVSLAWVALADAPYEALGQWRNAYWIMLAAPLVALTPLEALSSQRIMRLLLLAGGVIGGYAFLRWQIGATAKEAAFATGAAGQFTYLGGELRPIGGVGDAHALSSVLAPLVPFAFALLLALRDRWRLLAGLVLVTSGAALVATDVRAGLVAAAAGGVVVLALTVAAGSQGGRRVVATYLGIVLCIGAVGTVITLQGGGVSERSQRFDAITTPEDDPAFQRRIFVWKDALARIDDKPFGGGLGTATVALGGRFASTPGALNDDVVNSYLRVALEQGTVFAVALIAALMAILLALVRLAIMAATREASTLATAAAGTLTAFAIHLNFESIYIGLATALLSWLIIGLGLRQGSWRGRQPGNPPGDGVSARNAQKAGLGRPGSAPAEVITPNPRSRDVPGSLSTS